MDRRPIWDWACAWVGDTNSWQRRGEIIFDLLVENGLTPQSNVLNVGCGNLSEGAPLIRHLAPGHFVGLDPAGWLVEAALQQMPELESQVPVFLHRSDFDASELARTFDMVVAHSVLSHCAHHQLAQFLTNTRRVVEEGAVMLASFRNGQYNSFALEWRYPGHTTFRLPTVVAEGVHTGWRVEIVPEYRDRLMADCPNDKHDWLRCVAVPSAAETNERRLAEEAAQAQHLAEITHAEEQRVARLKEDDRERIHAAGLVE